MEAGYWAREMNSDCACVTHRQSRASASSGSGAGVNSELHTMWCLSAVPPPGEGNTARGLSESSILRRTDLG